MTSGKKINSRQERKSIRQGEKALIRGDRARGPRSNTWSHSDNARELPVLDGPSTSKVKSKKGCKRNKGGEHVIESWLTDTTNDYIWSGPEGRLIRIRYSRYHAPYRCKICGKNFYSTKKVVENAQRNYIPRRSKPVEKGDHYDIYNVKMRLLGLKCACLTCQEPSDILTEH